MWFFIQITTNRPMFLQKNVFKGPLSKSSLFLVSYKLSRPVTARILHSFKFGFCIDYLLLITLATCLHGCMVLKKKKKKKSVCLTLNPSHETVFGHSLNTTWLQLHVISTWTTMSTYTSASVLHQLYGCLVCGNGALTNSFLQINIDIQRSRPIYKTANGVSPID